MNASSNRAIRRRSVSPIYRSAPVPPPVTVRTRHPTGGQETNGTAEALVQQHGGLLRAPVTAGSRESVATATGSAVESTSMRHSRRDVNGGMSVSLIFSEAATPINDSPELRREEDRVRKRLAFHFLNPYEKYKERRMVPWKLIIQFFKVVLVTTQLIIFGNYRFNHTKYYHDNHIAFEHLFLKDWDAVREINAYPPATGQYAIYKTQSFYDYFDFIANTYHNLTPSAINPVFHDGDLTFCMRKFGDGVVFPNLTWTIDFNHLVPVEKCIVVDLKNAERPFSSRDYLKKMNFEVPWHTLQDMRLNFTLKTLTYIKLGPLFGPECFKFVVSIDFDNSDYDGQMPVVLGHHPHRMECTEPRILTNGISVGIQFLNYFVITLCLMSLILCLRAIVRAQFLKYRAKRFFKERFGWDMTTKEKLLFLNGWYIVICVNDILIIIGSVIKEMIESRNTYGDLWDFCALFLGLGNLLVWLGMLRYLGFFENYNILILTLKGAMPNIMRFIVCTSLIYMGFVFCGWAILGPYHFKFESIMSTSECLFSLINGDDMFATFSSVPAQSRLIYIFSRVYLYTFIALFIYVILSIFIAIIMDVYDVIKEYQKDSWPRCRVKDFYSRHYAASGGCGDSPGMGRANASMTAGQNAEEQDPIYRFLNRFVRWLCCHGGSGAAFVADDHDEDVGPLVRSTATT